MNNEIKESEALTVIAQMYQTQTFAFSSVFIATCIGLVALPLFVLNASLSGESEISFILRLIFCGLTLLLADTAVYYVNKTIYSNVLLREVLRRLKVTAGKGSSMEYLASIKNDLRGKFPVLRQYKMRNQAEQADLNSLYRLQIWGSFAVSLLLPAALFSFVWWGYDYFLYSLLGSELVYLISLGFLFHYSSIM